MVVLPVPGGPEKIRWLLIFGVGSPAALRCLVAVRRLTSAVTSFLTAVRPIMECSWASSSSEPGPSSAGAPVSVATSSGSRRARSLSAGFFIEANRDAWRSTMSSNTLRAARPLPNVASRGMRS